MANKVAVIGDYDSILGFKVLGLELFEVESAAQASETLDRLTTQDYAVVYITEEYALQIKETIAKLRECKLPAIVPIPSISGKIGLGMQQVQDSVKKAVGIDILGFEE